MGVWGYYTHPTEPPDKPEYDWQSREDYGWWEEMAEQESLSEFIEREMSYAEAMGVYDEIATDEGGWGADREV